MKACGVSRLNRYSTPTETDGSSHLILKKHLQILIVPNKFHQYVMKW